MDLDEGMKTKALHLRPKALRDPVAIPLSGIVLVDEDSEWM
jgi:hypothetical protein